MPPTIFDPGLFRGFAYALVRSDQSEAAVRTAIGRIYYSAYLKALFHFFPGGRVPQAELQRQPEYRRGSHAAVVDKLLGISGTTGSRLLKLQQLRIQADYRLTPDKGYVSWSTNWRRAQALDMEINSAYAKLGIV